MVLCWQHVRLVLPIFVQDCLMTTSWCCIYYSEQPKHIFIMISDVFNISFLKAFEVETKVLQLFVLEIVVEWQDRHSVVYV